MRTKRSVCEPRIRCLCRQWLLAVYEVDRPVDAGSFAGFYAWVERTHPEYLNFKPARSVTSWVGFWFEQECERMEMDRLREAWLHEDKYENS